MIFLTIQNNAASLAPTYCPDTIDRLVDKAFKFLSAWENIGFMKVPIALLFNVNGKSFICSSI